MIAVADPIQVNANPGPVGIGGWLIWPIIGFVLIVLGAAMLAVFTVLYGGEFNLSFNHGFVWSWSRLAEIFSGADGKLAPARAPTALTVLAYAALAVSASLSLYLVVKRRRALIPVAIAHYAIMAAAGLFEYWTDRTLGEIEGRTPPDALTGSDALGGVLWSLIWGSYFYLSARVRNTFVEPLRVVAPSGHSSVEPRS
jgi:hypothetical protein